MRVDLANCMTWSTRPDLGAWMAGSRLDCFSAQVRRMPQECPEAIPHIERYAAHIAVAAKNIEVLLGK